MLIDDHQKREVAGVDGRIIGLFSEPSQHPAEAVDSDLHLVEVPTSGSVINNNFETKICLGLVFGAISAVETVNKLVYCQT